MSRHISARTVATAAVLTALAMVLSYLESLLPAFTAIPGVKLGLANIAVVFALYTLGAPYAVLISLLRVGLSSLLFGQIVGFVFSLFGALVSLCLMYLCRRFAPLSPVGVSVAGGIGHNIGQILAALVLWETAAFLYYLPVLMISGTVAGVGVGVCGGWLVRRWKTWARRQG